MLTGEPSMNFKIAEEKPSNYPPSSPEDGEITDDDEIIEEALDVNKVMITIYEY